LSGVNLIATSSSTAIGGVRGADPVRTGKYYWEVTWNTISGVNSLLGVSLGGINLGGALAANNALGALTVATGGQAWGPRGNSLGSPVSAPTSGTIWCFAVDADKGLFWVRPGAAGNWNIGAANNPATGVGGYALFGSGVFDIYPLFQSNGVSGTQVTANFGDSAFAGVVPNGFTSGFTAGAGIVTTAAASQVALENWVSTVTVPTRAFVTQAALENWVSTQVLVAGKANSARVLA
jgi:hypothetical protein